MVKRKLGNTDLMIPTLTVGGNVFGWTIDEAQSFKILDGLIGSGLNFIDTADVYSRWVPENQGGESEIILGKWMKSRKNRSQIILATKVGSAMDNSGKKDLSARYIKKGIEDSLRRLQTDYVDLYQSHYDDPGTAVEETLEAYQQLIREGKIRWIGASNFSPERLKEALETSKRLSLPKYQTFQPEYNLYQRESFEKELEKICLDNQLGVISYYALASGFLTGKYRAEADFGKSARGSGMKAYLNERGFKILKALDVVAEQYNATPASVALAWLTARPSVTAPIVSITNSAQLEELTKATMLRLDNEELSILDEASSW